MRKLRKEIETSMFDLSVSENAICAKFKFPESFIGFDGHFKDNPILPGICNIQIIDILANFKLKEPKLKNIKMAKFLNVTLPNDEIYVQVNINEKTDNIAILKSIIKKKDDLVAKITCEVEYIK